MKNQIQTPASTAFIDPTQVITALKQGQIVTVPTETVYGYAVSLASEQGIANLMRIKSRNHGSGKVFTLVPELPTAISKYAIIPDYAKPLIAAHVPGELTLILPKNPDFRHPYYDHYDTIGIRIPNHPLFAEILPQIGPLLLTSANPRGGTPQSATGHLPSTIVDCTNTVPQIVRQGNLHLHLE